MIQRKKLIDTVKISDLLSTGGIFSKIANIQDQPFTWLTSSFALTLDKDYYLVHSGDKRISIAYDRLLKYEDEEVISDAMLELAHIIIGKYALTWNKIYSAINTNYSPLENYDMEQIETPDITKERKVATDLTETTSHEIDTTEERKVNTDMKNEQKVYGFNSSNPVPNGETDTTGSDNNNIETNRKTADALKNIDTVRTTGNQTGNIETETEDGTRTLTRHGNIGVTTSQQMLQSEIDLRNNFNFINQLMNDVDSELCMLVY